MVVRAGPSEGYGGSVGEDSNTRSPSTRDTRASAETEPFSPLLESDSSDTLESDVLAVRRSRPPLPGLQLWTDDLPADADLDDQDGQDGPQQGGQGGGLGAAPARAAPQRFENHTAVAVGPEGGQVEMVDRFARAEARCVKCSAETAAAINTGIYLYVGTSGAFEWYATGDPVAFVLPLAVCVVFDLHELIHSFFRTARARGWECCAPTPVHPRDGGAGPLRPQHPPADEDFCLDSALMLASCAMFFCMIVYTVWLDIYILEVKHTAAAGGSGDRLRDVAVLLPVVKIAVVVLRWAWDSLDSCCESFYDPADGEWGDDEYWPNGAPTGHHHPHGLRRTHPFLFRKATELLKPTPYDAGGGEDDGAACVICLSHFKRGEQVHRLRCKHVFHRECAEEWWETNLSCPTCRGQIHPALAVPGLPAESREVFSPREIFSPRTMAL